MELWQTNQESCHGIKSKRTSGKGYVLSIILKSESNYTCTLSFTTVTANLFARFDLENNFYIKGVAIWLCICTRFKENKNNKNTTPFTTKLTEHMMCYIHYARTKTFSWADHTCIQDLINYKNMEFSMCRFIPSIIYIHPLSPKRE